jgi:chemotaxis protein CheD
MKNSAQARAALERVSQSAGSALRHATDTAVPGETDLTRKKIYLLPGQLYASAERAVVTTILGSCVSVCLYDPLTQIGGVNHFLLPVADADGQKSPRFGNVAVPDLVAKVVKLGAERKRLQAKLFGGANVIEAFRDQKNHLGMQNVRIARELLAAARIPVIGEDVGGQSGRKLVFLTDDGSAWIKEL